MGDVTPLPPPLAKRLPLWARGAILAATLGLWLTSVFEHEFGGQLFAKLFHWGQDTWGPDGALRVERGIFVTGLLMAATVALLTAVKVFRSVGGRAAAPELLARWVAWFLFALAANRFTICLQSEDVHFAQYGFVAFSIALVTGNPRIAFLCATFMGFIDESNQWWRMYFHDYDNHLDFNDMILNACGACAGALPVACFARIRRYGAGEEDKREPRSFALGAGVVGVVGLIALYLVTSTDLGHYPAWPFWTMLGNLKPFHVLTLEEGLPALLGIAYVLYHVVDERRRSLPFTVLVVALLAIHFAVTPPRPGAQKIHERTVPATVTIPHAKKPPVIDGTVGDEEWQGAATFELKCFDPEATPEQKQEESQKDKFGPELPTRARVLWDEQALYVAYECATEDVWARKLSRDEPSLPNDSCVELFLDVDAAERNYYEFDITPGNCVQDLFVYWPESPSWIPHWTVSFVNLNGWDSKGLKTAVAVQGGECDVLDAASAMDQPRKLAKTKGYSVELALPWADLKGRAVPPTKGALLRANLCRIEIPRPRVANAGSYLTWSPTHVPLTFHRPQFFGSWQLGD